MSQDFKGQGELIVIQPKVRWAKMDRYVMDDNRLSIEARGVLCWIGSRPDGHKLFVGHLQDRCNISQSRWQRIRKELESKGYLQITKIRRGGKFAWQFRVDLVYRHRLNSTDGKSVNEKSIDSKSADIKKQIETEIDVKRYEIETYTDSATQSPAPLARNAPMVREAPTELPPVVYENTNLDQSQNRSIKGDVGADSEQAIGQPAHNRSPEGSHVDDEALLDLQFMEELTVPETALAWTEFLAQSRASKYWRNLQLVDLRSKWNSGHSVLKVLAHACNSGCRDLRKLRGHGFNGDELFDDVV